MRDPHDAAGPALLSGAQLYDALWASLGSLMRSYIALHGLHSSFQPIFEQDHEKVAIRHHEKLLILSRNHAFVTWTRENGKCGTLELTEAGAVRGSANEEAMDLVAEQWARELMR